MNDSERRRLALHAAQRFLSVAALMAERVDGMTPLERLRASEGALRAASYDAARAKVSTVSDPTGNGTLDTSTLDLRRLDAALTDAQRAVRCIERVIDSWGPARKATDLDRLALERLNVVVDPGCTSCARIAGAGSNIRWEPVDHAHPKPTTVGGRLEEPKLLCQWCYDAVQRWGRLPSVPELERHHRGERVPWPKDVPRPM